MDTLLSRRSFLGAVAMAALAAGGEQRPAPLERFPFYAMDTGLRGPDIKSLEDEVRVLADLGYWGLDYTLDHDQLPRLLDLLDKHGVQLACVYLSPQITEQYSPKLTRSIARMKGRPTRIELALQSHDLKPSDPSGDERALDLIRRACDDAADTGPVVSIYPHAGLWTERVEDGVRLARKSGRKNVGANFNLVHWKWIKQDKPRDQVLKESLPHLFAVSINGLDGNKIVPLDQGDYDVADFVAHLQKAGYRGPVGVQGYGIPGPSRDNLARSMHKWREILSTLAA